MLRNVIKLIGVTILTVSLSSCYYGNPQGQVGMIDVNERTHLSTKLSMTDMMDMAEKLTDEILMSSAVEEWGNKRPRVTVGRFVNNADVEDIQEEHITQKVRQILLESGVVRVVNKSSNKIDYVLSGLLDNSPDYNQGKDEIKEYRVVLELTDLNGEYIISADDRISIMQTKGRPLW